MSRSRAGVAVVVGSAAGGSSAASSTVVVVVVLPGHRVLELPHALPELAPHLRQPLRPEDEEQHEQQDQELPDADSEWHAERSGSARDRARRLVSSRRLRRATVRRAGHRGRARRWYRYHRLPSDERARQVSARMLFRDRNRRTPVALLEITNLHVALEDGTEIVKGVDLAVDTNAKHAIMGPNGSGKSTLAYALMGHPAYEITEGDILLRRRVDPRARRGRARPARPLPRLPVPARDPGRDGHELPAQRDQREAQGGERRRGRPGAGQGVPHGAARGDGAPQGAARARAALPERRVLGRREEARRDPADGDARSRGSRSSTRPTRGSTSTRCASSRRASTRSSAPTWARS